MNTESTNTAGEALDLNKSRAEFEAWWRGYADPNVGSVEYMTKRQAAIAGWQAAKGVDADELVRLRRLVDALGMDGSTERSDGKVRGLLFVALGRAADKIESAALARAGSAAPAGQQAEPVVQVDLDNDIWMDVKASELPVWEHKKFKTRTLYAAPVSVAPAAPIPRYALKTGDTREWLAPDENGPWCRWDHVVPYLAAPAAAEWPSLWQGFHTDDAAVRRFAAAMMRKMAVSRKKGRHGWDDETICPTERLQEMLIGHLAKGDPLDVANFCMMLWNRNAPVAAPLPANAKDAGPVISSYDIEKVKSLKFQFVESLIHGGVQYRTCGAISAALNRIVDESAAIAAQPKDTTDTRRDA